ncbi:MAG TPA: hypothetical protein VHS99_19865 [Chloroflexota bacterium]|jgi:hypothetical protein|nr:hypothetical protein [Chloroflexota bacterium]
MISGPGGRPTAGAGRRGAPRQDAGLSWWLVGAASIVWRLPVLLLLVALGAWFAFRALVHMAFLFDSQPFVTFLLAPLLMPFAALPAACFYVLIRFLPRLWRRLSPGQRVLIVVGAPCVALVAAVMVDLLHINLLRMAGIRLPRLPFDPY